MSTDRVLVCNAHAVHGLVAVRSLGRRGLDVTAGSRFPVSPGALSRYAERRLTYPDPESRPEAFVRALERELEERDYDALLPINEVTVATVARHRDRIDPLVSVPFDCYDRLLVGLDKCRTTAALRAHDVPRPETLLPEEVDADAVADLGFPVVLKPARGSGRDGVAVCESLAEFETEHSRIRDEYGPTLVQEYVPNGGEAGAYALYHPAGERATRVVQQRIRTRPPEGGVSTYRETIADPEVDAVADDLLSGLDWHGVAMVEFRRDPRDGEPKVLELNPRLWGSLALSTYAGADFPYLLYQLAVGEEIDPDPGYTVGVRARSAFADLLHALERPDRLRAFAEVLTPGDAPERFDVLAREDPLPAAGQVGYWLTVYLREASSDGAVLESSPVPDATVRRLIER
ncbi:carboxylate--amine ligase [Halomicrobium urmianum]|uniref:carboxylate--amine ligase n=1 Tax=Halomicrobium urmianum TaxID=1586233 RepID=UPI001CD98CF4|nr:ATP-grasp domain-containing protein [Halomicrobium urmianum]